jgi:hypothetical protein
MWGIPANSARIAATVWAAPKAPQVSGRGGAHGRRFVHLTRQHDPKRVRLAQRDATKQLRSVDPRHAHVRDHGVEPPALDLFERRRSPSCEDHLPQLALAAQTLPQSLEYAGLVVHEQQAHHGPLELTA